MRITLLLFFGMSLAYTQVYAQQYDFEKLASDLFSGNPKPAKVAITTDLKSAGIASLNAKAIEEAITTAIQRKATSQNHSVIAASELAKIYDYKQFTGDRSDFAELAEKLKADLLILVTVQKLNSKSAQVSGKLLGVSGDSQGKVLGASKVYEIPIAAIYRVYVEGVFENNERREKLDDNVLIGLTNTKNINVLKTLKNKANIDYIIRADISYTVEDIKTKEAQGAEMFSDFVKSFKMEDSPAKGMTESLKNAGKAKVITVISKLSASEADGKKIITEHAETKSLPPDVSSEQLKSEAGRMAKISLKTASEDIAKKISGESTDTGIKTKSKSLLD